VAATRLHIVVLLVIVGSATAGRAAYAYWVHAPGKSICWDMAAHDSQARHLWEGTLDPGDTFRPMGYPALIAAAYAVSSHPLRLVALVQTLAGGLTCLLAYLLARRASLSPAWSLLAASLVALYPPFVYYGSMLLTESVSPLLFILMVWLMLRAIDTSRWQWAAALGVTFSAASLVRTNFLPFALVIAVCVWVGVNRRWKIAVTQLGVAGGAALPLLVLACALNSSLTGRWSGPSTNGGLNFFMMQAEVAFVRYYDMRVGPIRNVLKYHGVYEAAAPFYEEPYYYREGLRLIRADPWGALARAGDGVRESLGLGLQTFWPASGVPSLGMSPLAADYEVLRVGLRLSARAFLFVLVLPPLAVVVFLVLRGALLEREHVIWLAVAGAFVTMLLTSLLFLADPRMHIPYDGLLIVASVAAVRRASGAVINSRAFQRGLPRGVEFHIRPSIRFPFKARSSWRCPDLTTSASQRFGIRRPLTKLTNS
jgi:4-amino-4-deoxy-L-arabinose transferase-like glycosyltransferase